MTKMMAIAKRILLQFAHDRRTLALLFIAPIIVLWLLSVLLGMVTYEPKIGTMNVTDEYQSVLEKENVRIKNINSSYDEGISMMENKEIDGLLIFDKKTGALTIKLEGSDSIKNRAVKGIATKTISKYNESLDSNAAVNIQQNINSDTETAITKVKTTYLHGDKDWKMFDYLGPVFIGIFIFVFTFITRGMSLVNERSRGTMARFLATPVKLYEILGGYSIGFCIFAMVQTAVIFFISLEFIDFPNEGNLGIVVLVTASLAIASVTLGLLVSGLATNAFQVVQLMLVFVVPQILLCGFFDLSGAPKWLQIISQ